VVRIR
jgi:urocanate hydratase